MSHIVTRKGPVGDDKEKRQTDSPVKEMKKKIAANAEKEKQAAEKSADKTEKAAEKSADKKEKAADKHTDKTEKKDKSSEKHGEKSSEKKDKSVDKNVEKAAEKKDKSDKSAEKSVEKPAEKKDKPSEKAADKKEKTDKKEVPEKSKDETGTGEKSGKPEKPEESKSRKQQEAVKLNGNAQNGSANGAASSSDDDELIIVEQSEDNDEMFPELAYDDNSDADGFEPDTTATRSLTRRSQVKATRTPETPRPASAAHLPRGEHSKEPKVLRLKEDAALTDRRLRSAGSPKPTGKDSPKKAVDSPTKGDTASKGEVTSKVEVASKTEVASSSDVPAKTEAVITIDLEKEPESEEKTEKPEMEVVIEVENSEDGEAARRDTRYSRSRVKVSPYRRSARLADVTHASFVSVASHTSLMANYTGNNTTMEMDITESSMATEGDSPPASPGPDDSYLAGLRAIRGRRSYKLHGNGSQNPHVQMAYARAQANANSAANASAANVTAGSRPTGTVVGRKRRPHSALDSSQEEAEEAPKRARLLERLSRPFRTHSTPLPARRAAEIVGVNTDLPLSAPVGVSDPESLKPPPAPAAPAAPSPRDHKRCLLM